jgi:glycosyltransferase involved in cell wall biosynthesis
MSKKVNLSIVTVCFNAAELIEDSLRSAIEQTYTDFELVIIDGGSNDQTLKIIEKFKSHIGTLVSEPDLGIYDAMNKGVKAAKGEWIYFLNAGDSFHHPEVLAEVFSNQNGIKSDFIYAKVETKNEPTGVNYLNGKPTHLKMFYSHYPICHQSTFARKKLFDQLGYFDLKYPLVADSEWFIRVFKNNQIRTCYLDLIVAYYDIQGASYHKRMKGYREYINVGFRHFPLPIAVLNMLLYPVIWGKVWVIRTFQHKSWFIKYRQIKFEKKLASSSSKQ